MSRNGVWSANYCRLLFLLSFLIPPFHYIPLALHFLSIVSFISSPAMITVAQMTTLLSVPSGQYSFCYTHAHSPNVNIQHMVSEALLHTITETSPRLNTHIDIADIDVPGHTHAPPMHTSNQHKNVGYIC